MRRERRDSLRWMLVILSALALFAASVATAVTADAAGDPSVVGAWSAPFDLQAIAIHSIVLPGGKVLLFHRPRLSVGSDARVWDPVTGSLTDVSFTSERDVFCSGHSVLPDGRVLVVGGHVHDGTPEAGVRDTDLFDPATGTWTAGPLLRNARWYPSTVETGDGRVLAFGGTSAPGTLVRSVESFDPATGTLSTLPSTAAKYVDVYPQMHVLPDGRLFMVDQSKANAWLFDPVASTWTKSAAMGYGKRLAGTSVLLPGLRRVLALGGSSGASATATAEVIEPGDPQPAWRFTGPMAFARKHPNAVLLADGTVLAVGGGAGGKYDGPVRTAERYDPAAETWSTMAAQTAPRMYHSTAVLLPDGRVLSAGQDLRTSYAYAGEIYSPPYLFAGPRPVIAGAPSSVTYGQAFAVRTPDGAGVARVALVRPGSVTHSVDFDQRYVDLAWTLDGSGNVVATAPPDGNQAPPGWYMLFLVNDAGVPSVASWVHVGTTIVPSLPPAAMAGTGSASTGAFSVSGFPVGRPDGPTFPALDAPGGPGNEDSRSPALGLAFRCVRRLQGTGSA